MPRALLHPGFRRLSLYADGDLPAPAARTVSAHLERCPRCRETLGRIRAIDDQARALPTPPLPRGLRGRVLAGHRAGETVILPAEDAPVRRPAPPRWWIAAAVLLLAVVGAPFVFPSSDLEANRSELVFSPAAPRPGDVVRVVYRPGSLLSGEERLRLRARYRRHDDLPVPDFVRQAAVAELARGSDGRFHGTFRLPDSVVFAALAVEDREGARVDSNRLKLWELLVHGLDGRPRFEALMQRQFDHMGSNWELSQANARQGAALYPGRVDAWFMLFMSDRRSFTGPAADSAMAQARARLAEFDRRYRPRADLAPEAELGIITRFAAELGDTARYRYWRERLLRTAPGSLWGVQERFFDIASAAERDPRRSLAGFDSLWSQPGAGRGSVIYLPVALDIAIATGDLEAIRRWADRVSPYDGFVGVALVRHPALREEGMTRLRARLRELEAVDHAVRPLERTVAEERVARRDEAQHVLAALGKALMESGRRRAALDTLALATRTGWDAPLFRRVAALRLELGDTAGAAAPLALAAADPLAGAALADSARLLLGPRFDASAWSARLADARGEMRERVLARSTSRALPGRIRLRDADGRTRTLREIAAGRPVFVAFWYRYCPYSAAQLAQLQRVAAFFQARGYAVVTVTEPLTPELRRYLSEHRLNLPVYGDDWNELGPALDQRGTPSYFVLDGAGNLRFGPLRELTAVPAQMAAVARQDGRR